MGLGKLIQEKRVLQPVLEKLKCVRKINVALGKLVAI